MDRDKIKQIAKEHFDQFDILKVEDVPVEQKAEKIYQELPIIYKKLDEAKVLPEGINFQSFMHITVSHLQAAANMAYMRNAFGF